MKSILTALLVSVLLISCNTNNPNPEYNIPTTGPIQLHPQNPHYFLYKAKPLALITSAEHYGALLNLDFDYKLYLKTLAAEGMNYTRIFAGSYFEIEGESFAIQNNTLAPKPDRIITPWKLLESNPSGELKYDLNEWNETYFERLDNLMLVAADLDIIVEVTFFSSIYNDNHWDISPQNPENNINIEHSIKRSDAHTLINGSLLNYQISFVRKLVNELNTHDNFFFEIQNEPWADRAVAVYNTVNKEDLVYGDWSYKADFPDDESMAWQEKMASIIAEEESNLPQKHLIAQNYTNYKAPVPSVSDRISIINFHYAWPEAAEWNYHYEKVLGFDESGFAGSGDQVYRRQAWQFMLSGGGLFNNLDYSFFVGHEDGLGENKAPGGGSKAYRKELKILSDFLHSFELEKLYPNTTCIKSSAGLIPYVLSDENNSYAIFLRAVGTENTTLQLKTGDGNYLIQKLNTITGSYSDPIKLESIDGLINIEVIIPNGELAIKIIRE